MDKKFIGKTVLTIVVTAIVMFLLQQWMGSFQRDMTALRVSIDANTTVIEKFRDTMDDLRNEFTKTDAQIVVKFNTFEKTLDDHEDRIRELERK